MPREVPQCILKSVEITEEYFLNFEAFLRDLEISPLEAQIIVEVLRYPEHHIDLRTLKKKIPSELFNATSLKDTAKNLVEHGFLQYYESKKEEICVLCDDAGRLVAEEILESCYSENLRHYPSMCEKFKDLKKRRCIDHEHFKQGAQRIVSLGDFKLKIKIEKVLTSDSIVDQMDDGSPIFGRRLVGRILKCPKCQREISLDYTYDHKNLYTEDVKVRCNCGFEFLLARCLKWAYVSGKD